MSSKFVLKKGLDLPISGKAELRVSNTKNPGVVAVRPGDFKGLSPRLLVREGDAVMCGSPVLADKTHPEILVTSPVSGRVKEVVRGEKRKLLAVLIENDFEDSCVDFGKVKADDLDAGKVRKALLDSGMWMFLIQRPYGITANPEAAPKGIFVSAFDSAPLAPSYRFCFGDEYHFIQSGITALSKLAAVNVSVCSSKSAFAKLENCSVYEFEGKHPAGNVGVQISHISPIMKDETVWTVSMAGVAAIGKLFEKGRVDLYRKVAVTGPMAIQPSYINTLPGMPMGEIKGHTGNPGVQTRIVSGNVLCGSNEGVNGYLGFFDNQITIIKEGREKELFGWIRPIRYKQFSTDRSYFSWLMPWRKYDMDTNLHGGPRAFIMNDAYYSKVLPMDIYPLYLTKACLAGDIDKMEKFGIYEVLPEDLATCEFVDPSKNNIQDIIAKGIDLMLKEMA